MRTAVRVCLAAAFVTVLLTSSSFAQKKPVKEPYPFEPFVFEAGAVCAFPVRIEGEGNQSRITFPSGREMIVGAGSSRVINAATGESLVVGTSGLLSTAILPDGTARLIGNGQSLTFLFPQDVNGPALILTTGHMDLTYDIANDMVTSMRASGRTFDLYAALE